MRFFRSSIAFGCLLGLGALAGGCGKSKSPAHDAESPGTGGTGGGADAGPGAGGAAGEAGVAADATTAPDTARDSASSLDAGARNDGFVMVDAAMPVGAAVGIPGPWLAKSIGVAGGEPDKNVYNPSAFWMTSSAPGIGGTADAFSYVYQAVRGDGLLLALVDAISAGGPAARGGIMFRASTDPGAPFVFFGHLGDGASAQYVYRQMAGGPTMESALFRIPNPKRNYVRILRAGNTFTMQMTESFGFFDDMGTIDVPMPADALAGFAADARGASTPTQVTFARGRMDNLASDPAFDGWMHHDPGPTVLGSAFSEKGKLTLTGFGAAFTPADEIYGSVHREVPGVASTLVAKVSAQSGAAPDARGGVMFRMGDMNTQAKNAAMGLMSVTADQGIEFRVREGLAVSSRVVAAMPGIKAPVWLKVEIAGDTYMKKLTGSYSADGTTWTELGSATAMFPAGAVAMLMSSAASRTALGTVTFENVALTP